jgi:hypothetical protein
MESTSAAVKGCVASELFHDPLMLAEAESPVTARVRTIPPFFPGAPVWTCPPAERGPLNPR